MIRLSLITLLYPGNKISHLLRAGNWVRQKDEIKLVLAGGDRWPDNHRTQRGSAGIVAEALVGARASITKCFHFLVQRIN